MKNPTIQNLKTIIEIVIIITSLIIIYNHNSLKSKVAIVTKDEQKNLTQIKYTKGTEITEKRQNDGEEQKCRKIELNKQKEILANKLHIELLDYANPDNIKEIATNVLGDNIIINFSKPNDNGTSYEYLIKNNNLEKNISYYSKSNIKGYSYSIDNNQNNVANLEINKTNETPITYEINDWNKDYYLHIRTFDRNGNYTESKTFKIDLPSDGVIIKYIDINNGEEIDNNEVINGNINQEYDATKMIKNIDNYQLLDIEGNIIGTLKKDELTVACKYAKNTSIKVDYINSTNGEKIADSTFINTYEGKNIIIKAKEIEGYNYLEKEKKVTIDPDLNNIKVYYTEIPKGKISVNYVEEDSNKIISDGYIIEDYINTDYTTEKRDIEGYEIINNPENSEGKICEEYSEVTYFYKKTNDNNKEDEKEKNTYVKYVDYDTKEILDTEMLKKNKKNYIKIKKIEGYKLMDKDDFNKDDFSKYDYKKEESLIDELINSLDIDNENIIIPDKEKSNIISEYEIVMNCDDSDYIIYYKK